MEIEKYAEAYLDIYRAIAELKAEREQIALGILQVTCKDSRADGIVKNGAGKSDEPATEKQIAFLRKHGIEVKDDLTKQEAYQIVKDAVLKMPKQLQ